jgi:predicted O-methyltransferase YrrM
MFFFRASRYLLYYLFSGHRKGYGIHSPFTFNLVSRVFRNKIDPDIVLRIESIRKKNKSDKREVTFNDLGAGSVRMDCTRRKVSDITSYSSIPAKYGILLSVLASEYGNKNIVEFGTSVGISTMYLASGSPDSVVYTMEGCHAVCEIAKENFKLCGIENIRLMEGSFDYLLPKLREEAIIPELVFIDGHHKKEPVLRYFNEMADMSGRNSVIIIDDIHQSPEMEETWNEIRKHERVSVTIDIFRMGIAFLRQGMNRINYIVRY